MAALLILLILLTPVFIQSGFHQLDIRCDYAGSETVCPFRVADSCAWKVDLSSCQTLQMHCTEQDRPETVSFCSSSKDCGFSDFPDYLIGALDCEITKAENGHGIKCQLSVECGHEKHVCATPKECHWNPNPFFKEIDDARCVLKHDVSRCVKTSPNWNLTENLNCTIKPANTENPTQTQNGSRDQQEGVNADKCDCSFWRNATFVTLGIAVVIIGVLGGLTWKFYKKANAVTERIHYIQGRDQQSGEGGAD